MKKTYLLTGALAIAGSLSAFGQGYMDFSDFTVPITIGSPSNPGSQSSGWYLGSDYSVEAYMSTGAGASVGSLAAIPSSLIAFIGNATSASGGPTVNGEGLFSAGAAVDTGLPAGDATIQVRAWYNGGIYSTYEAAFAAGVNTGVSGLYTIALATATSPVIPTPVDAGMTAFTVAAPVPEPATLALAGLGGFGMLMALRRKKA